MYSYQAFTFFLYFWATVVYFVLIMATLIWKSTIVYCIIEMSMPLYDLDLFNNCCITELCFQVMIAATSILGCTWEILGAE